MTKVTAQMSISLDGCYAGARHDDPATWMDGDEAAGFVRAAPARAAPARSPRRRSHGNAAAHQRPHLDPAALRPQRRVRTDDLQRALFGVDVEDEVRADVLLGLEYGPSETTGTPSGARTDRGRGTRPSTATSSPSSSRRRLNA